MGAPVLAEDLPDNMVPADDLPDTTYNGLIPAQKSQSVGDLTNAATTGINAGVADLAGLPMDTATNVANLGKAAVGYPYSKITGKAVPAALEASDPADVAGTSEWIKKKIREHDGSVLIDASNPDNPAASLVHNVAEMAGPAVLAEPLGELGGLKTAEAPRVAPKPGEAPPPPTTAPTTTEPFTAADMRSKTPTEQPAAPAAPAAATGSAPVAPPTAAPPAPPAPRPGITHTVDPDTGEQVITSPHGVSHGDTMRNGDIKLWRNDTDPAHQGEGEGTARLATAADAAHAQGTNLVSSSSESQHSVDSYHALQREGYDVQVHPGAEHNPETGNYTLPPGTNPNDSVFTVGPKKTAPAPTPTEPAEPAPGSPAATMAVTERRSAARLALDQQRDAGNPLDLSTPPVASEAGRGAAPTAAPASPAKPPVSGGSVQENTASAGSRFTLPSEEGTATAPNTPAEAAATADLIKKTLPQLNEVRTGALNNDRAASGQVFQQAKVNNAIGARARNLIGNQDQAMREEVGRMAVNKDADPVTQTARGQAVNDAFDAAHEHFARHVNADYTAGQIAGKQFPAKTDNFNSVMTPPTGEPMPPDFMSADGQHLYKSTLAQAKVLGLTGDSPARAAATADRIDALRQFVNQQKTPGTWRQAKTINNALDKDLQASMPANAFEQGRRNRTAQSAILERNDTVAKFAPSPDGIEANRGVQPGAVMSKLAGQSTSVGQFHDVFDALRKSADHFDNIGDHAAAEDIRTKAAAAQNAMSDHLASNALKAGQKIERGWDQKSFAAYLQTHEAKMADLNASHADGGAAVMQKWKDLNEVGNALKMDRAYPGAAAQYANINMGGARGAAGYAADKALTGLGALKGGPVGAMLGEVAGRRAASFIGGNPEARALKAFEAEHVTNLNDVKPGGAPPAVTSLGQSLAGAKQRGGPKFEPNNPYNNTPPNKDVYRNERTVTDRSTTPPGAKPAVTPLGQSLYGARQRGGPKFNPPAE
jgi:hypothetical protein